MKPEGFRKKDIYLLVFGAVILHWGLNYLEQFFDLLSFLFGVISPFLLGIGIAFLLNLPMRGIEKALWILAKKLHLNFKRINKIVRPLSIFLTLLIVGSVISGMVAIVVPKITETITALNRQIPVFLNKVQSAEANTSMGESFQWIGNLGMDFAALSSLFAKVLNMLRDSVMEHSFGAVTMVFDKAVAFGIAFVLAIYILSGKERLAFSTKKLLSYIFSQNTVRRIIDHIHLIDDTFSSFFRGQCLEACILGVMFFVGITIFRFPNALLISVLVSITALIPVFGAFIACIIGAFLMLVQSPMLAVWFVIFFLIMQQIEGNLIYPHVMGSRIGLPSVWVLVAATLGGTLFGILGMLLFIPIFSILYTLIHQFFDRKLTGKASDFESESGLQKEDDIIE
ncbi:MAG: AI-2E family transporter [Massiliimalia sp.]